MATVYDTATFRVETRASWSDPWETQTDLQPMRGSIAADNNNQAGQFVFTRFYGDTKYPLEVTHSTRAVLSLDNHWVRVTHIQSGNLIWQGRFLAEPRQVHGNQDGIPSGIQTFVAYDGHTVLSRLEFFGSTGIARNHDTNTDVAVNIDHVLTFNTATGGNRSAAKHTNPATTLDSYVFDVDEFDNSQARLWSAADVVEYLLATRLNDPAANMPTWTATGLTAIENIKDVFDFGQPIFNVLSALRTLIRREYGVGFVVLPTDAGFNIKVFGLLADDAIFNGVTVPANAVTRTIDVNASVLDLGPTIERSFTNQHPEIVVIGNRMVVAATFDRSQLDPAWTPDLQADYQAIGDIVGPVTGASLDAARQAEKYRYLFSTFYVNPDRIDLPEPRLDDAGSYDVTATAPKPRWSRSTLITLPLYEDRDYTTSPPNYRPNAVTQERLPVQCWMQDAAGRYHGVDSKNCHVEVLPDLLGVRIGAPIPHYVTHDVLTLDAPTEISAELTTNDMQVTLAWESDYRQTLKSTLPGANRLDGRKVIHVDANLWMLAPRTVIDVDAAGNLVRSPNEWMAVLDEKSKLDFIMAGAVGRYTLARQRLTSKQQGFVDRSAWLGDIIHVVNDGTDADQIRGPLTSINWNFVPHHHTTLKTGFGTLNKGDLAPLVFRPTAAKR